jgi:hypothetical protein
MKYRLMLVLAVVCVIMPVQNKDGNHGWEAEYDERGNQTVVTYLGLDGKRLPTH